VFRGSGVIDSIWIVVTRRKLFMIQQTPEADLIRSQLCDSLRHNLTIEHQISQKELSHIVGMTRSRVSEFMRKFRELGLIETRAYNCLVVRENQLSDYLTQLA
jgi:predicted XRE-type DNA-binding protein